MLPPIFIIGCPRSGTTLLSQLLEPTVYGAPVETHFIPKYFKKLPKYGDLSKPANLSRLLKDILSERPVMQWKLNINIDEFRRELDSFDYVQVVSKLCYLRFKAKGKSSWGDKTPHYILELDIIFKLFPNSKYIYIIRDGRDVALSLLKKPWGPNNVFACAEYWKMCNRPTRTLQLLRERGQLFELTYEELLEYPEETVEKIYNFLQERYIKRKLGEKIGGIQKGNFNKWKSAMSARDVKIFESVASDTLVRHGYEIIYSKAEIGRLSRTFWRLHDMVFHYKHLIKMNTIDAIRIKYFGMEPFAE